MKPAPSPAVTPAHTQPAKRILLLDTGKEWGGGTNSMFELLKRIDRQRFSVTALFYRNYAKGKDSDLRRELAAIGIPLIIEPPRPQPLWAKLAKELVRGIFWPFPTLRRRALFAIEQRWRIVPAARRIASQLRGDWESGGYDLLYMNNQPSSNLEGYLAAEMTGKPLVQHARSNADLSAPERVIVNRLIRRANACIICVSHGVKDHLVAQGVLAEKCHVIHNAIDIRQPLPAPATLPRPVGNTVVVGSVGSLLPRKAQDHLIRALAAVRPRLNTGVQLVLVGDGTERERLMRLAEACGLASIITFAGFRSDVLAWLAAMDIVVLSSNNEGFPRTILEAMLLSKPVIASNVIGSRELVADGISGRLYPFGDIPALAAHLECLISDSRLRARMGAAGRAIVEKDYAIEGYVNAVERVLEGASA